MQKVRPCLDFYCGENKFAKNATLQKINGDDKIQNSENQIE